MNVRTETDTINSWVSGFVVNNAGNVRIYHNTILLSLMQDQSQAAQTSIFYAPSNSTGIIAYNNLFSNSVLSAGGSRFSQMVLMPINATMFTQADYNVYTGPITSMYRTTGANPTFYTFQQWQTMMNRDQNSTKDTATAYFTNAFDFHIDGPICGQVGMLVPMLALATFPGSDVDMDGPRGTDSKYPNITTAGSDEVMIMIEGSTELPAEL
jgi:hypothetical protein